MDIQHVKRKEKEQKKKKKKRKKTYLQLTGSLHYCTLLSKEFLLFSTMPLPIEMVTPIRTTIAIYLMVFFAVYALEDMRTQLPFHSHCTIHFLIFYATPHFLSVMFGDMSFIVLSTSRDVRVTTECRMLPFPTILALWNIWVHIHISDGTNISSNVKSMIDDVLCHRTTL